MDGPGNLKTFDEVCQALYTSYTSRLNGMNSFVKSKNWPASKWKFQSFLNSFSPADSY